MKISLILLRCDFNKELYLLTKAACETLKADECILIDNGSSVGEINWGDKQIKNRTNLGYPAAINQGFAKATGDAVAVANNDIRVSPNWLYVAKEILMDNPQVGSVHFKMIPYDEPFNLSYDTWIGGKERWCHASFYVIRKQAIPTGGYFEEYKEGGYDDYDFFHRMRDVNGWIQAYTNRAAFQHKDSSTYEALDRKHNNRQARVFRNRELYRKRFGEYPDIQFIVKFPEQMSISWKPFP